MVRSNARFLFAGVDICVACYLGGLMRAACIYSNLGSKNSRLLPLDVFDVKS
jgi:hypothetical protein